MKTQEEKITQNIKVSADEVWKLVAQVGGVDQWFPSLISSCTVEGDNRYCETVDGIRLEEKILDIDHDSRTFRYSIPKQDMLPVENIVGTIRVLVDGDHATEVEWSATFEATEENAAVARQAFKQLWAMGLQSMESYILNSRDKATAV